MMKKLLIIYAIMLCCGAVLAQDVDLKKAWEKAERGEPLTEQECIAVADEVHRRYITLDSHNDTSSYLNHPDGNYSVTKGQVTFPMMKKGGLDAAFFAIYLSQKGIDDKSLDSAYNFCNTELELFKRYVEARYDEVEIAYEPKDFKKIKAKGKSIVVLAIENAYPLGYELDRIDEYFNKGVRYITLCHNSANTVCDASVDKNPEKYGGLSGFGYEVIERMNKLGMIIDVSHASTSTLYDVLEYSKAPIIASHSAAWELKHHKRNLTDDELRAIAAKGGVIQCATGRWCLSELPKKEVTVKHLVDHLDHMKAVVGADHIGLGTDFDGGGGMVGFEDCTKMREVTKEMLRRGYTPAELEKFWGGNLLRVWDEIIKVSKRMK